MPYSENSGAIGQNIANAITGGRLIAEVKSSYLDSTEKHYTSECKFLTVYLVGNVAPLEYFVKQIPESCSRIVNVIKDHDLFRKEAGFFTVFLGDVDRFCAGKFSGNGIHNYVEVKDFFPKVVYASDSCIYSENLKMVKYVPSKCTKGQDFIHAQTVLSRLAKFQARTFAMIKEMGDIEFIQKYDFFREAYFTEESAQSYDGKKDSLVGFITPLINSILNLLKKNEGTKQNLYYRRLAHYENCSYSKIYQVLKMPTQFLVVNHGDLWNNNMFFNYDVKGLPQDVKFFDMQVTRVNSSAVDISYYFNSLDVDMRKLCCDRLLQCYYEKFRNELILLGLHSELSFSDFMEDFRRKSVVGFIFGLCGIVFWSPILTYVTKSNDSDVYSDEAHCSQALFTDVAVAAADWVTENEEQASALLMDKIMDYIEEWDQMGVQF